MYYNFIVKNKLKGVKMTNLIKLVNLLNKLREKKDSLKIELEVIKTNEYTKWKEENPKDRTAMDKVLAQLKEQNEVWKNLEEQYNYISSKYSKIKTIYDTVQSMMNSQYYSKEEIELFISSLLKGE